MGALVSGDVAVVPFPFSDLSATRRRPALVLVDLSDDDGILCQITSQVTRDAYAIPLLDSDFAEDSLRQASLIRPNRLFTADSALILYRAGRISDVTRAEVTATLIALFQRWMKLQRSGLWSGGEHGK